MTRYPARVRNTLLWLLRRRPLREGDAPELDRQLHGCFARGGAAAVVAVLGAALTAERGQAPSPVLARGACAALLRLGAPRSADDLLGALCAGLGGDRGSAGDAALARLLRVRSLLRAARIGRSCLVAVVAELDGIECEGNLRRSAVALERLTGVSFEVAELIVSELAAGGECDCELARETWLRW